MSKEEFTSSGLVRELAEAMYTGVPTHLDWAEGLAATIIGTMMGKERYISNDYGNLYGNVFLIYIGASGLSFKTVPLKKVVRPLVKILTDRMNETSLLRFGMKRDEYEERWNESTHASARDKKTDQWKKERAFLESAKGQIVDLLTLQRFTSEKLTSWLNEFPWGVIVGDEYTKLFKGAHKKDYLMDNMEDLSRLYDCDVEKVGTISRGVEYPEDAYVSFVSATTYYLMTLMTDDFFIQGTGNRIMWIVDDMREKVDVDKEMLEKEFFWNVKEDDEFKQQLENLVEKLMNILELPEGLISLSYGAAQTLNRYRLEKFNEAVDHFSEDLLDKDANLIARLAQNAMKLALIHCVGRYADEFDPEDPPAYMEIDDEDAQWAIGKMGKHLEHYMKIRKIASRVAPSTMKTYRNEQDRVLDVIERMEARGEELTANVLRQQTGWDRDDCRKLLETMIANGQIVMVTEPYVDARGGARKKTYFTRA